MHAHAQDVEGESMAARPIRAQHSSTTAADLNASHAHRYAHPYADQLARHTYDLSPLFPPSKQPALQETIVEQHTHTPHWGMLTHRDRAILLFEIQWTNDAGVKHERIRQEFGIGTTRYYMVLGRVIDDDAALEAYPVEVGRLRRVRAARIEKRANRVF